MNKRERIKSKTNGHCYYCGVALPEKGWHINHIDATWRGHDKRGGNESEENMVPACARCNRWKSIMTPDKFKKEIESQFDRLYRDVAGFRLAVDYGLIVKAKDDAKFYFEQ